MKLEHKVNLQKEHVTLLCDLCNFLQILPHRSIYSPLQSEPPRKKKTATDCISRTSALKTRTGKRLLHSVAICLSNLDDIMTWVLLFHCIPLNIQHKGWVRQHKPRLPSWHPNSTLLGSRRKLMTNVRCFTSCLFCSIPKTLKQLPSEAKNRA